MLSLVLCYTVAFIYKERNREHVEHSVQEIQQHAAIVRSYMVGYMVQNHVYMDDYMRQLHVHMAGYM